MHVHFFLQAFAIALPLLPGGAAVAAPPVASAQAPAALPGRDLDGRVARIAHRLAIAGAGRCPARVPAFAWVLHHLTQYELPDRAKLIAAYRLDRGPGVAAVVPGGPAAQAGIAAGDVLLAINGIPLPAEPVTTEPFDQRQATTRAEAVSDLLAHGEPLDLTLLRGDAEIRVRPIPALTCPSRVHLARSGQRNAYADGLRVLVTTALVEQIDDEQLAFMIAHEMAHNILGHAARMRGPDVQKGLGRTLGRSGAIIRSMERAADALGAELLLDADFNPVAGARVLRRVDGDLRVGLFAAHDSTADRIAAMRGIAAARRAKQGSRN